MRRYSSRVQKLIQEMNIDEKINQLSCTIPLTIMKNGSIEEALMDKEIPHGIGRFTQFAGGFFQGPEAAAKAYNEIQAYVIEHSPHKIPALMQNEALTGLVAAKATAFPIPLSMAASWQPDNVRKMGEVIDQEARAIGVRMVLSPVADVARDGRWGRIGETFGEDPLLVSRFASAEAEGIQQQDIYTYTAACAKHFMGYAASEGGINRAHVALGRKELLEVHGAPFAAMIKDAHLEGVMATYNEIDGLPMSINNDYMNNILRDTFHFNGVAICDALSIPNSHSYNGIGRDMLDVVNWALEAGIDADTPITTAYQLIKTGVEQGRIAPQLVDAAVGRVLDQKERLGLFAHPFVEIDQVKNVYNNQEHQKLSKEMAAQGMVLIQNRGALPLSDPQKIAVIGPFADKVSTMFGGYAYTKFIEMFANAVIGKKSKMEGVGSFFERFIDKDYTKEVLRLDDEQSYDENIERYIKAEYQVKTPLEAIREAFPHTEITYAKGLHNGIADTEKLREAHRLAEDADTIILMLGEVTGFGEDAASGEGTNNSSLCLDPEQERLITELHQSGKPIILVLFNGRPLLLSRIAPFCNAILEVWYPGPYGGEAIVDILSGRINPSGKLPLTFPQTSSQCPIYYGHRTGSGYLQRDGSRDSSIEPPFYPFGYGLSYTTFKIHDLQVNEAVNIGDPFEIKIKVTNTGNAEGSEVVQIYSRTCQPSIARPVKELRAFYKVKLKPQSTKTLTFILDTKHFAYYDRQEQFVVEPSDILFMIGNHCEDIAQQSIVKFVGEAYYTHQQYSGNFEVKEQ